MFVSFWLLFFSLPTAFLHNIESHFLHLHWHCYVCSNTKKFEKKIWIFISKFVHNMHFRFAGKGSRLFPFLITFLWVMIVIKWVQIQRILYQNFVSICGIILVVITLLRHFKIVRGPNPNSGWFKDVVKAPVIRSILHLVYYMIN